MKPREYCCCAIPLVNAGIYATLTEQMALGILVGVLAVGTPSIVGASTPSFAPWLLAIVCFVAAGIQLLGFLGVAREKSTLYRRYVSFHGVVALLAFCIAAAWIIVSATRHNAAKSACILNFFTDPDGTSASEGDTLCTIFPWVDVGIMGSLWLILAALHIYLYIVVSSYGSAQRRDHELYDRTLDPTQPLTTENIPLDTANDPWDSRPSTEYKDNFVRSNTYKHVRQLSTASASDVLSQQHVEPKDSFSNKDYSYSNYGEEEYKPTTYPSYAYTQDPAITPIHNNYDVASSASPLGRPPQSQPHPAEGSFRRKTPRYGKP